MYLCALAMAATRRDVLRTEQVALEAVFEDGLGGSGEEYRRLSMKGGGGGVEMAGCSPQDARGQRKKDEGGGRSGPHRTLSFWLRPAKRVAQPGRDCSRTAAG